MALQQTNLHDGAGLYVRKYLWMCNCNEYLDAGSLKFCVGFVSYKAFTRDDVRVIPAALDKWGWQFDGSWQVVTFCDMRTRNGSNGRVVRLWSRWDQNQPKRSHRWLLNWKQIPTPIQLWTQSQTMTTFFNPFVLIFPPDCAALGNKKRIVSTTSHFWHLSLPHKNIWKFNIFNLVINLLTLFLVQVNASKSKQMKYNIHKYVFISSHFPRGSSRGAQPDGNISGISRPNPIRLF